MGKQTLENSLIYAPLAGTDVLLTSFWGWSPETWGTMSFSSETRRDNLTHELSDPFIGVVYITSNKSFIDPAAKGKIAGFYVVSHDKGFRNQFTDPIHHNENVNKWQYGLRAIEAYTFLPEHRIDIRDLIPNIKKYGRTIAKDGQIITGTKNAERIFSVPCEETVIYRTYSTLASQPPASEILRKGYVHGGGYSKGGYRVSGGNEFFPRELYILKLQGDTDSFLGKPCENRNIYKIGMSASPEARRQSFQKALPKGAYKWAIHRSNSTAGLADYSGFHAAIAGENAMKRYLSNKAEWLGGEFYLASDDDIETAWEKGVAAANEAEFQ